MCEPVYAHVNVRMQLCVFVCDYVMNLWVCEYEDMLVSEDMCISLCSFV